MTRPWANVPRTAQGLANHDGRPLFIFFEILGFEAGQLAAELSLPGVLFLRAESAAKGLTVSSFCRSLGEVWGVGKRRPPRSAPPLRTISLYFPRPEKRPKRTRKSDYLLSRYTCGVTGHVYLLHESLPMCDGAWGGSKLIRSHDGERARPRGPP